MPELAPPTGPPDRQPRLLRDRGAARARARWPTSIDPASVVVDAKSGVSGAGRALKETSHAGFVLENVSPYRVGTHQHAPEIEQALGFPVCFVPHLLPVRRGLIVTCYANADADEVRERLEEAYAGSRVVHVLPEGVAPELARVQGTDAAEIGVFEDERPAARSSSARSTTSARARRARPSRTRTSRSASTRPPGFGSPGCSYERHRRAGLRRERRALRDPQDAARPRARPLDRSRDRRGDVHRQPRAGRAGRRLEEHLERAQPQAVVVNSGVANAATGEQGDARRAGDGRGDRAAARARARSRCSSSRPA